jgi:hypothetical protein
MGKNQDPGSAIFIPDHISKSLETIFWVKKILQCGSEIRNLFYPGSPGSGMAKFGSGINIPNTQLNPGEAESESRSAIE